MDYLSLIVTGLNVGDTECGLLDFAEMALRQIMLSPFHRSSLRPNNKK
jgi:hypothetical protein